MAYPHQWSPISCRSSAGQGKFASQRPTFYHCATPPTKDCNDLIIYNAITPRNGRRNDCSDDRLKHTVLRATVAATVAQCNHPVRLTVLRKIIADSLCAEGREITHAQNRNPCTDLDKILHGGRYHRRSCPHKFWWPSVKGFLGSGGSNFPISHWLSHYCVSVWSYLCYADRVVRCTHALFSQSWNGTPFSILSQLSLNILQQTLSSSLWPPSRLKQTCVVTWVSRR